MIQNNITKCLELLRQEMIAQKMSHVSRSFNNNALLRVAKFSRSSTRAFGAAGHGHEGDDHHHHAHPVFYSITLAYFIQLNKPV